MRWAESQPGGANNRHGLGGRKVRQAFEVALLRAEAGEPWAQLRVGICYENAWGTERNLDKAEYWYKKAAAQKADGEWAEGLLIGAVGRPGYFNQNSDARIAQFNLAQLYYHNDKNLREARDLVETVIRESEGKVVFFCCEFSGGRYFTPEQFQDLKRRLDEKLGE